MLSTEAIRAVRSFTLEQRAQAGLLEKPFEVAYAGISSGVDREQDRALAQAYAAAGVTWWLEHLVPVRWGSWSNWPLEVMRQRILQGPPRSERT